MTKTTIGQSVAVNRWEDFIGQKELKGRLEISIEAAVEESRIFEHTLFISRPGYGKTTLARLVAEKLYDPLVSFTRAVEISELLMTIRSFPDSGIILLDEIHAMPKSFLEFLYTGMQNGYLQPSYGPMIDVRHITFFGATTEPHKVPKPLWDRFTNQPHFVDYTNDEMSQIIVGMAQRCEVTVSDDLAAGLAQATGGTPRVAERLVAAVRDLTAVGNNVSIDSVLYHAGVDHDGLTGRHLDYLRIIDAQGGVAGLATLTTMMQMPAQVLQDLERLLISRGLLRLETKGRTLTNAGYSKLHGAQDLTTPRIVRRNVA